MNVENELLAIGHNIRMIRLHKGLKQVEVARKIGLCPTALSNIENGRLHVTLSKLLKLKIVLDCHMADFFDDEHGYLELENRLYKSLYERFNKSGKSKKKEVR